MKDGKYTVDSIEKGIVKLLLREDESVEELLPESMFPFEVREGLILQLASENKTVTVTPLVEETLTRRDQMKTKMEELKNRK